MQTSSIPITYTKTQKASEFESRDRRKDEDSQSYYDSSSELESRDKREGKGSQSNLDPSSSFDKTSPLGTQFTIDEEFKSILKDQIKEYISILKKLEIGKIEQLPPEKIVIKDFVHGDIYERVKKQFEQSKDKYDKDFYEFIESKFREKVPLVKMKQKMATRTFERFFRDSSEKELFYNGCQADHWYLLPRELDDRFKGKYPNILRLNKYLGLTPFHDVEFEVEDDAKIKIKDNIIGIHECYVFLSQLSSPKQPDKLPIDAGFLKGIEWEWDWNTKEFDKLLVEKEENKQFKCFCNFLEKRFIFDKKLDDIFKEYDDSRDIRQKINDMILNIGNDSLKGIMENINEVGEGLFNVVEGQVMKNDIDQIETLYNNIVGNNHSLEPVTKFKDDLNKLITSYALWDLINWSIPWSGEGRTLDYGLNSEGDYILNGGSEFYIPSHDYLNEKFTPILTIEFTPIKQQDEGMYEDYHNNLSTLLYEKGDEVKSEGISIKN